MSRVALVLLCVSIAHCARRRARSLRGRAAFDAGRTVHARPGAAREQRRPRRSPAPVRHAPRSRPTGCLPQLAASVPEPEASGRLFRIRLRPGLRFHDGSALTAATLR